MWWPEQQTPGACIARRLAALLVAAAGVAWWLAAWRHGSPARAWHGLLANFLFFAPLAAGLPVWSATLAVTHARWPGRLEEIACAGFSFAPVSLLVLAALGLGLPDWSPWVGVEPHQRAWLAPRMLYLRDAAALVTVWALAAWYLRVRRLADTRSLSWAAGIFIFAYGCLFSLIAFDLVMALDPHWHSSMAGGHFFIGGIYTSVLAWTVLSAWSGEANADRLHDLGRLIVAFGIMTTYLAYAQLLPMWYENLPSETRFWVPRLGPPWRSVSWLVLGVAYLGPLVLLLTVRSKRNRWSSGLVALLVLAAMWVERWWLVAPTFDAQPAIGAAELAPVLALGALFVLGVDVMRPHVRLPVVESELLGRARPPDPPAFGSQPAESIDIQDE